MKHILKQKEFQKTRLLFICVRYVLYTTEQRKQYIYSAHNINRCLKKIGAMLGLSLPLTMYVARHTWASIAKQKKVPISVISDGLGHDSELTTRIYLSSLDNIEIDKANKMIMRLL